MAEVVGYIYQLYLPRNSKQRQGINITAVLYALRYTLYIFTCVDNKRTAAFFYQLLDKPQQVTVIVYSDPCHKDHFVAVKKK